MDLGGTEIRIVFPGPAGEHQRSGRTASLVRELGDNYDRYHEFLAEELGKMRDRPEPADFDGDLPAYAEACDRLDHLIKAEVFLRSCWRFRQHGEKLGGIEQQRLFDADHRLLSAETGKPSQLQPPSPRARAWKPPPSAEG